MKNKGKLLEFLTLFAMTIGSVVGAGVYFKNKEILFDTRNPIIAIILWIIVGSVCVSMVYLFLEIASSTKKGGSGTIGVWTKLFINRKVGSFFAILNAFFYLPVMQSMFISFFITFILMMFSTVQLKGIHFLLIFLTTGIAIIIINALINVFDLSISRKYQAFGTIFKFIPLAIALIAGVVLFDQNGAFLSGGINITNPTGGTSKVEWSTSNFNPLLFFRGFGGILFTFDGFIFICNSQRKAKYKDVVPKALIFGMIFVSVFYTLIAVSLLMGSPDGSIGALLGKLFNGGKVLNSSDNSTLSRVANILTSVIIIIICSIGANNLSYVSFVVIESDVIDKLYLTSQKNISAKRIAIIQVSVATAIYSTFILVGTLATVGLSNTATVEQAVSSTNGLIYPIQIVATSNTCLSFIMIITLIIGALFNRKTNKVEVEKKKGFVVLGTIAACCLILFVTMSLFTILVPLDVINKNNNNSNWFTSNYYQGPLFILLTLLELGSVFIFWCTQEKRRRKYDLENPEIQIIAKPTT
ncbi:APC family permease [Mycoplasma mycoides]|uniref:Amino acid permease n=1 Tax=Mycoplasma mycoides subsp. mycoides SC (strain CCUG 32753 / NCTC 10114 / PG1) TaxID=272632 RepID=Q6MS69_MYCMS|nr:Amino acid permease [Mycoplasma mycoides subsp. mycoides SC str. PG1]